MKLENNLGTDAIRPLVLRIAIPSMLAQFVSVLYSIVDRIYISNIPLVGNRSRGRGGLRAGGDADRRIRLSYRRGRRAAHEHPHGGG